MDIAGNKEFFFTNWLQVLASTKLSEIDERKGDKFETEMVTLFGLKAQQQAPEFILPGKGTFNDEAQFVERVIKEAFASRFGLLPVAWLRFDIEFQPGIEDTLAISFAVKACVQIEHGTAHRETSCTDDALEVF